MSENPIPIIDVSPLFSDDIAASDAVDQQIGHACETMSSFMVIGLPDALKPDREKMDLFFSLFHQSEEIKIHMGNRVTNPNSTRGYRGLWRKPENLGGKQYFDMGPEPTVKAPSIEGIDAAIEPNVWPPEDEMPGWTDGMLNYFRIFETFGIMLIESIARYLGVDPKAAAARYAESNSTLRLLWYPDQQAQNFREDGGVKRPEIHDAHTDNDGLAILWQDAKGLQMQSPAGAWNYIPDVPEGYSVHLGDALETQTAGRLLATPHRVLGQGVKRRSIAFFLEPGLYGSVKPFSVDGVEPDVQLEDTYGWSIMQTLINSGRA
ncbi:MAG: 2OG-Fe(II) oxygenase family protein [Chloroflexota bacterium]